MPQVIKAIAAAVPRGLALPIVYNTSAYDALASLRLLDGIVDIYMPDFKFWQRESARRLAKAKDYPERARAAILEMQRQVGSLRFGPDGLARRGLLVRHLVMPGEEAEAQAILQWLADEVATDTYVNVMSQYRPHLPGGRERPAQQVPRHRPPTARRGDGSGTQRRPQRPVCASISAAPEPAAGAAARRTRKRR